MQLRVMLTLEHQDLIVGERTYGNSSSFPPPGFKDIIERFIWLILLSSLSFPCVLLYFKLYAKDIAFLNMSHI